MVRTAPGRPRTEIDELTSIKGQTPENMKESGTGRYDSGTLEGTDGGEVEGPEGLEGSRMIGLGRRTSPDRRGRPQAPSPRLTESSPVYVPEEVSGPVPAPIP